MEEFDFGEISGWLGLTSQQFEILKSMYKLEAAGKHPNPSGIMAEYRKSHPSGIEKSNLFRILRELIHQGLVKKSKRGDYRVDFEGVREALTRTEEETDAKVLRIKDVRSKTEEYFKREFTHPERPSVEYLDHDDLYRAMGKAIDEATSVYIVGNFPMISYTAEIVNGLNRTAYVQAMHEKCFRQKRLDVNYLTNLDIDALFNHAFRVLADPGRAYDECHIILDKLENQVKSYDNLEVRYMENPHGLDVAIPEERVPREFFLFTRDEHGDIMGGMRIKSRDTAANAKQMFMRDFEYADDIRGNKGETIIKSVRETLEKKYGVLKR